MQTRNWKELAELGGISVILIGLVFVYLEIQQNGIIARAELLSGTTETFFAINQQLSDPDFAKLYMKSLHSPTDLTESERLQINALLDTVLKQYAREIRIYDLGVFGEYEDVARGSSPFFFGGTYGRAWWEIHKGTVHPTIAAVVDDELSKTDGNSSWIEYDAQLIQKLGGM